MRILVLGGTGMLGHKMFQVLGARFPGTLCTTREAATHPRFAELDFLQGKDVIRGVEVTDLGRLQSLLKEIRPDFIVNCVGIIKSHGESQRALPNIEINALLPHKLAAFAREWGGRVIQPSTDCVFDGKRGRYTEMDESTAQDLYGRSKFLGELHCENALTLRTSFIGRELTGHRSLLDWFLSQEGRTIKGFKRVIYSGVTTNELADVVTLILQKYPTLNGLFQVVSEPISKYELLCLLRDAYKVDVRIVHDEEQVCDRSMMGARFRGATGYRCPPWPELVARLAADPTPYPRWTARPEA